MGESPFVLRQRLEAVSRVVATLALKVSRIPAKHPSRRQMVEKLDHARMVERMLNAELGTGPQPTHVGKAEVGGVKIVFPVWEAARA